MILAIDRASHISIKHAHFNPTLSFKHIGEMRRLSGRWKMSFTGRNWAYYTDSLNGLEKAQIIRLLAKLNGENHVVLADQDSLLDEWNKIIGKGR